MTRKSKVVFFRNIFCIIAILLLLFSVGCSSSSSTDENQIPIDESADPVEPEPVEPEPVEPEPVEPEPVEPEPVEPEPVEPEPVEPPKTTVEINRDDKGVWFITGTQDASLFNIYEAQGYAVASDRLWQSETFRRAAKGKLAEIFGEDQLKTDIFMRTIGYSDQELEEAYNDLNPQTQEIITGYTAGYNRRIAEIRADKSLLPFEFAAVGARLGVEFIPQDWTASDILAWLALFQRNFDSEGYEKQGQLDNAKLFKELYEKFPNDFLSMFQDLRWINDPDAVTYIPKSGKTETEDITEKNVTKVSILGRAENTDPVKISNLPDIGQAAENMADLKNTVINNMKKINAFVQMGSYAWTIAGSKTASGNPILYSGPQMGFSVPGIICEGSIRAGELNVSGMALAGVPGILIGRTPHHTWSSQVGHAHTVDYYLEAQSAVTLHRVETIKVAGGEDVQLPVYRTSHGPVINPLPYNPETYVPDPVNPIVAWKYAHWGYELKSLKSLYQFTTAASMDEFGEAVQGVGMSQHFCYADKDGNIAYWMSGRDPVRPEGEYRLPQGFIPTAVVQEWDPAIIKPKATDRNTAQGFYSGWNNKSELEYGSSLNNPSYSFGPFHRAHVLDEYFSSHDNLTFEQIRDMALDIAATDSFRMGGNPWTFVSGYFSNAVNADPTETRTAALAVLEAWDGHFVDGGKENWASGTDRSDGWMLMDAWTREAVRLTFEDELGEETYGKQDVTILFNAMLHSLAGPDSGIVNIYNWFQNLSDSTAPQTAETIIVTALDNALTALGDRPWGVGRRGEITYQHDMIGPVHTMPFSSRSSYAHCVEMGAEGPVRIDSMFLLGESGNIIMNPDGTPEFDPNFFSMTDVYDKFVYRNFPLFN